MHTLRRCFVFTVMALSLAQAEAATFWVAPTGHDAHPGTSAQPCRTINGGIGKLSGGDTLIVRPGTYTEFITDLEVSFITERGGKRPPSGTSWATATTIKAETPGTVIVGPLEAFPGGGAAVMFERTGTRYIVVEGLVIDPQEINSAIFLHNSDHIRFRRCELRYSRHNGIIVGPYGQNTFHEFIELDVHHSGPNATGSPRPHGMYMLSNDNLIERCRFHHNAQYGIQLWSNGATSRNIVRYNFSYENEGGGIVTDSGGVDNQIYGNVVWNNKGLGIVLYGHAYVWNNTLFGNGGDGGIYVGAANCKIHNNLIRDHSSDGLYGAGLATATVSNNWTDAQSDPRFVNAAALNFRLQPGSPCIDAGTTIGAVSSDPDGTPRPQGAAYDIGAYEFRANFAPQIQSEPSANPNPVSLP